MYEADDEFLSVKRCLNSMFFFFQKFYRIPEILQSINYYLTFLPSAERGHVKIFFISSRMQPASRRFGLNLKTNKFQTRTLCKKLTLLPKYEVCSKSMRLVWIKNLFSSIRTKLRRPFQQIFDSGCNLLKHGKKNFFKFFLR